MNNNKIGLFVSEHRKKKELTQQELGNLLYVTDKAVSKWERGISLPDITILKKLAEVLDVEVSEILNGEKNKKKNIDIEKAIEEATKQIKINQKEKLKKLFIITIFLIYIIFRNLNLGYSIKTINYTHTYTGSREINIGVPKLSFMMKNRDYSYSYKNFRSSTVIENELKSYLKTLTYSTCNDTIYYYNEKDNYSIIEYSVKNNILYSTISYAIVDDDYCYTEKIKEYSNKLGGLRKVYSLNNKINSQDKNLNSKLVIHFIDGGNAIDNKYEFSAQLTVFNLEKISEKDYTQVILEESIGDIEIKNDKLYYYRKEITDQNKNIKIPEVSIFDISNGKLILTDNYLSEYYKEEIICYYSAFKLIK